MVASETIPYLLELEEVTVTQVVPNPTISDRETGWRVVAGLVGGGLLAIAVAAAAVFMLAAGKPGQPAHPGEPATNGAAATTVEAQRRLATRRLIAAGNLPSHPFQCVVHVGPLGLARDEVYEVPLATPPPPAYESAYAAPEYAAPDGSSRPRYEVPESECTYRHYIWPGPGEGRTQDAEVAPPHRTSVPTELDASGLHHNVSFIPTADAITIVSPPTYSNA